MSNSRLATFNALLDPQAQEHRFPLSSFRRLCSQGIPDEQPGLRAQCWRVLLGLVDAEHDKKQWENDLQKKRASYWALAEEVCARVEGAETSSRPDRLLTEVLNDVHRTSELSFFRDRIDAPSFRHRRALLDRIDALNRARDKDKGKGKQRQRERGSSISSYASSRSGSSSSAQSREYESPPSTAASSPTDVESLWEGLFRLLCVFATVNPALGYVQGLNELAAPLMFVFGRDDPQQAEADAFWALSNLVNCGIGELLTPDNDKATDVLGLPWMFAALTGQLDEVDPALAKHLVEIDLRPPFYALRWFLIASAQDFALPDLLRLWDALLAEISDAPVDELPPPLQLLVDIATAIVLSQRNVLMDASFPTALSALQAAPAQLNVDELLQSAFLARQQRQAEAFMRDSDTPNRRRVVKARRTAQLALASAEQASRWWSKRITKAYESDASANLTKAAINAAVQSKRFQQGAFDFGHHAPSTFGQLGADLAVKAKRQGGRPPSPEFDAPFKPPSSYSPAGFSPRSGYSTASPNVHYSTAPPSVVGTPRTPDTTRQVKPLLLSSSARRSGDEGGDDESIRSSRRSSWYGMQNGRPVSPMPYAQPSERRPSQPVDSSPELSRGVEDIKIFSPRIQRQPRRSSGRAQPSASDADDERPKLEAPFEERRASYERGVTLVDAPASRKSDIVAERPPRGASLTSPIAPASPSGSKRSRLMASARKRLSGGFSKSPPVSPVRSTPPPLAGDRTSFGSESEVLAYYQE